MNNEEMAELERRAAIIERVVKMAVDAERERCARIAETYAEDIPDADQDVFGHLAQKIRGTEK